MYVVIIMHARQRNMASIIEMCLKCVMEKRNLIKVLYLDLRKSMKNEMTKKDLKHIDELCKVYRIIKELG